jgi:hypothetical protein
VYLEEDTTIYNKKALHFLVANRRREQTQALKTQKNWILFIPQRMW